jgi:hypothetical protein
LSTISLSPELSHSEVFHLPSIHTVIYSPMPLSPLEIKCNPKLPPIHAFLKQLN